mmetsp:Transcript_19259/g.43630  ORF Transcript_19259/g.43630 Transcript_19259/m.43630 type:complete len:90 (-) Transcript_19259:342-611(-)
MDTAQRYFTNPISSAFSRNSWRFIMMPYLRMSAMPPGRPDTRELRKPLEPGIPRTGAENGCLCGFAPCPPRGPPPVPPTPPIMATCPAV